MHLPPKMEDQLTEHYFTRLGIKYKPRQRRQRTWPLVILAVAAFTAMLVLDYCLNLYH